MTPAFWCISNNFGDTLTRWLVKKKTGGAPIYVEPERGPTIIGAGSILNWAKPGTIVWGAGLAALTDGVCAEADIRAVRGPLSRARALACGARCPEVYGDPATLLPRLLPSEKAPRYALGIVPHYVDQKHVIDAYGNRPEVAIIDVFDSVEEIVARMMLCECVIASSLHGLVVAAAYGLPCAWAVFGGPIGGDGTKYRDFLMSVHAPDLPVVVSPDATTTALVQATRVLPALDVEPLLAACPF